LIKYSNPEKMVSLEMKCFSLEKEKPDRGRKDIGNLSG